MSTLLFTNPGEIDIRGATIAGLSAKADTSTAIGFFGTGLKYAIASILRLNGQVSIYSGTTCHRFEVEDLDFRGAEFKQVVMISDIPGRFATDRQPLGFTTEYGKTWEPWQLFRELYANCLDEGGDVTQVAAEIPHQPIDGETHILITCPQLLDPCRERDCIILPRTVTPTYSNERGQLFNRPASSLYYRGVRVADRATALCYNLIEPCDLTEDRTLKEIWVYARKAAKLIQQCADETLITTALTTKQDFEKGLTYNSWDSTSPEFIAVAKRLYRQNPRAHARLKDILDQHCPEETAPQSVKLTRIQQMMLDKAIRLSRLMGVDPDSVAGIVVAPLGDDQTTLGQYNRGTNMVYLAPALFDLGTKQVLSTLYEELIHAQTGKADCNYDMQTFLFNKIVSLHEEHIFGEPI